MKIKSVILENFRIFKEKTVIDFDDFTALIGKNDIGKSTILEALEIFFNDKDAHVKIDKDDLNKYTESEDILIGVVFNDLPEKIKIDATFETTLSDEYLLNKDGYLEIHKIYSKDKLKETSIFAYHPKNEELKDLLLLTINELKKRAKELDVDLSDEDKRISAKIRNAIRKKFSGKMEFENIRIPIDKAGTRELWDKLQRYLPIYALFQSDRKNIDKDDEIQDPMNLAVQKILKTEEIQNKLNDIQEEVENAVKKVALETIEKLREMNPEIASELKPVIPSQLKWSSVFKGITISSDGEIPLNKRGSGVRRLILLNFFRAEAENKKNERNVPNIIYAFEEPETSQHPDHQKKLIEALINLSRHRDNQIIITTHSPGIASMLPLESLRYLSKENGKVYIEKGNDQTYEKIAEALGVLPTVRKEDINKIKLILCFEGPTDIEFFKRLSKKFKTDKFYVDLDNYEEIIMIPLGGSTLKKWVNNNYLRSLNIPEIHIYDRDRKEYKDLAEKINNENGNRKAIITDKNEIENYVHPNIISEIFSIEIEKICNFDKDWVGTWDNLDIPKKIKNIYKSSGKEIKESKIKEKISTEGIEKMEKTQFKEIKALEEIEKWFKEFKKVLEGSM
ncbi:ATP-binding protein [Marinitoga litoralis]|uniref:ATP-binding protein n=1 Tax=Marinitoga litoralis TaxID=570855 RepID=UPI001960CFB9|nr:ATP-binding protein [Marinitoga litoralis]MBM7560419.1 putative ATP-dependent endonuclease of OLD family [Marinitoga litoralis]